MSNLSMTVTIWVGTNLPEFIILNNAQNKKIIQEQIVPWN